MKNVIERSPSTLTSRTADSIGTSDQTVQHYNGREVHVSPKWRNPKTYSSPGESYKSTRYPDDLSQTMKSCINKIDEEHKRVKDEPPEEVESDEIGGRWANFFTCCGGAEESTLEPFDVAGGVLTDDDSASVSTDNSLEAILDEITNAIKSSPSSASEDAMLLDTSERDKLVNDSARRNKRCRGPLRSSSSDEKGSDLPPRSPMKSSIRDIASSDGEQWRSTIRLNKGLIGREIPQPSGSQDGGIMLRRSRSHSLSGNDVNNEFCKSQKISPSEDDIMLPIGRQTRSYSKSGNSETGYVVPPLSPKSPKITSFEEIARLDMLVELQKQEAQIEKKMSNDDKRGSFRRKNRRSCRKLKSAKSEHSIFSFPDDQNTENKIQNVRKHVYGPPCGSYENISIDGLYGAEINNTYSTYRMDPLVAEKLMSKLTFSLPLYHSFPPDILAKGLKNMCSEPAAKDFYVRGRNYMVDSIKIPSKEAMFSILGANNVIRKKAEAHGRSDSKDDFLNKFRIACQQVNIHTPFILIINFIVPWGTFNSYYYRPNGTNGGPYAESERDPSEKLWRTFLTGDNEYRNSKLKIIPNVVVGPWVLKKMVGPKPGMVGQKLPVTYSGSVEDGYLQVSLDITRGGKLANRICSACASKSSIIAVDLAFLLEGTNEEDLPEQVLSVVRLHHVQLK